MDNIINMGSVAHTKTEINEKVTEWCDTGTASDLEKYIFLKELEQAVEIGLKYMKARAKQSYLEISDGSLDKKQLFGVKVEAVSTVKKNTLAKTYIYSNMVDTLTDEIKKLDQAIKDKQEVLKAQKMMEINNGTAKEITAGGIIGEEVSTPVENTFDLKITFNK